MITQHLDDLPIWNTALPLPMVTNDSELFECQILLGGLSLVLSRLHPQQGKNRFTYTRGLVMKLARLIESSHLESTRLDGSDLRQMWPSSQHLAEVLSECERALDTGTLIVLRRMQLQALKDEQADAVKAQNDSRFGASVSGALEPAPRQQVG